MLADITTDTVFLYFLIFCRIGSAIMMLPSISEGYMSARSRLIIALGLTIVTAPVIAPSLPKIPASTIVMSLLIAGEILYGLVIGIIAKIILSAMHVAGFVISYQTGLSAATLFDPSQQSQSSTIGAFLTMVALMIILATDMHHIFIYAIIDSYNIFKPGEAIPIGGFSDVVSKTVAGSFMVGIQIAAPQIVAGLLLYLSAGVMSRLMPQMQVFFVMIPVQIIVGFLLLMITLSTSMMWFMNYYGEVMGNFIK